MLSWVGVIKRFRIDSVYYRDEVDVANSSGGEVSVVCQAVHIAQKKINFRRTSIARA